MKIDLENLKNKKLIEWVRNFGVKDEVEIPQIEGLEISKDSIGLFDDAKVKMLVTKATFNEKIAVVKLNLKQLADIQKIFGKEEAFVLVRTDKEYPAIVTDGEDIVLLAPMTKEGDEDE